MRTKDELFREALRHIAARRQQAVTSSPSVTVPQRWLPTRSCAPPRTPAPTPG